MFWKKQRNQTFAKALREIKPKLPYVQPYRLSVLSNSASSESRSNRRKWAYFLYLILPVVEGKFSSELSFCSWVFCTKAEKVIVMYKRMNWDFGRCRTTVQGESKVLSVLFPKPIFLNKQKCFQKQKILSLRVTSLLDFQL